MGNDVRMRKPVIILLTGLSLAGCTTSLHFAGHDTHMSETITGSADVDIMSGNGNLTLVAEQTDIRCEGKVHRTGHGRYAADVDCSDGRKAKATIIDKGFGRGTATATDECGNKFSLIFAGNEETIKTELADYRKRVDSGGRGMVDACHGASKAPVHRD